MGHVLHKNSLDKKKRGPFKLFIIKRIKFKNFSLLP